MLPQHETPDPEKLQPTGLTYLERRYWLDVCEDLATQAEAAGLIQISVDYSPHPDAIFLGDYGDYRRVEVSEPRCYVVRHGSGVEPDFGCYAQAAEWAVLYAPLARHSIEYLIQELESELLYMTDDEPYFSVMQKMLAFATAKHPSTIEVRRHD